jgi:hypothetical protein
MRYKHFFVASPFSGPLPVIWTTITTLDKAHFVAKMPQKSGTFLPDSSL